MLTKRTEAGYLNQLRLLRMHHPEYRNKHSRKVYDAILALHTLHIPADHWDKDKMTAARKKYNELQQDEHRDDPLPTFDTIVNLYKPDPKDPTNLLICHKEGGRKVWKDEIKVDEVLYSTYNELEQEVLADDTQGRKGRALPAKTKHDQEESKRKEELVHPRCVIRLYSRGKVR